MTEDAAVLIESWSARELADKIADNTPDDDGFVLRVLAARLAQRADQSRDPAHLFSDLSSAIEAIAQTTRAIIEQHELTDCEDPDESLTEATVEFLECAAGNLHAMHNWF